MATAEQARVRYNARKTDPAFRAAHAARSKAWNEANPEKRKQISRNAKLKAAGWTPERWETVLASQGGTCWVADCQFPPQLCADHDHDSMEPRGILCQVHNLMLVEGVTPAQLRQLAYYLELHNGVRSILGPQ